MPRTPHTADRSLGEATDKIESGGVKRIPVRPDSEQHVDGQELSQSTLGSPPPHIASYAPPFVPGHNEPFGKLVVNIVKGKNLKAGQGVFGKADPYVKMKLGDKEEETSPHLNGGKNPVSL